MHRSGCVFGQPDVRQGDDVIGDRIADCLNPLAADFIISPYAELTRDAPASWIAIVISRRASGGILSTRASNHTVVSAYRRIRFDGMPI